MRPALKKVVRTAVAAFVASVLVGGAAVAQAGPAKRPAPKPSGSYTYSYADKYCLDFVNPTGQRIQTARCPRLISTLSGAQFAHDVEVTPLTGAGLSYGQAVGRSSFVSESVQVPSGSVLPVSVSVHINRAEVFGPNLPTADEAGVGAFLWVDGCSTADGFTDYAQVMAATTEGAGPGRVANIDLTLTVNCATSEIQSSVNVHVDVSSWAVMNQGCLSALHVGACGFVPGAGPLRAVAEGAVGSIRIG